MNLITAQKDGVIFSCPYCPFKTVKQDNILSHIGTHHQRSEEEQNRAADAQQQVITNSETKKPPKKAVPAPKRKAEKTKASKKAKISPPVVPEEEEPTPTPNIKTEVHQTNNVNGDQGQVNISIS